MFSTLLILVLVVFATPITILFDGVITQGLVAAIAALSLAIVALQIRPGEAGFLSGVIRPVAVVAVIPAVWMLVQVLPIQNVGLAHPIWKSTAAALGHPVTGSISIDPGATLVSFVRYVSATALAFVAAAVATDRRRAEWILFALVGATTLIALMALALKTGIFTNFSAPGREHAATTAADGASLGVVFATAAALPSFERSEGIRPGQGKSLSIWPLLVACLIALATCFVAVVVQGTSQAYYAVFCGLATLAIATIIRRYSFGPWGIAAIISVTVFVAIAVITLHAGSRPLDLTVTFASQAPGPLVASTQHMLAETRWAGTGAGTFAAVLPIYQGIDELGIGQIAPTAAAAIAIEMGWLIFWAMLMAAFALVFFLLRGALRRQRDSYFSTAGAGCTVVTALLSFSNVSLFTTPISAIVAIAIGMAIAQSKSRLR